MHEVVDFAYKTNKPVKGKQENALFLFIHQDFSVFCHSFHADIHLLARGIIEKFHFRLALGIGCDVGLPPDSASEIGHRGNHIVVFGLEGGCLVETIEVGATDALVALGGVFRVQIDIDAGMAVHVSWVVGNDIDRFYVVQKEFIDFDSQ